MGAPRGKLGRRHFAERAVRAGLVIIFTEGLYLFFGVFKVDKLLFVQALIAELAVEALDEAVLGGFPWGDEAMLDLAIVGPALER
jgi:hypothetical protein